MEELNEIQNITHAYRKQLAEIERREGKATQSVVDNPFAVSGEERQKLEQMDADLTALEYRAQAKSLEERLAKLENAPRFETRSPKVETASAADGAEESKRWLRAIARNDMAELRTMATDGTNFAVPTDMERRILNKMYQASAIRQIANVTTVDSNRTLTVEASTPAAALVAEGGSITPADFTFDSVSIASHKFVGATQMTLEFIQDSIGANGIGSAVDWVAERLGVALARKTDESYTTGETASGPQGIGACASTSWASTNSGRIINQGVALTEDQTVDDITADNVIDLVHSVPVQYRVGDRFRLLMADGALKAIRKLKDSAGYYVFSPAGAVPQTNVVGTPATIYGVPYTVGAYMPTTAAQTGTGANVRGSALVIAGNFEYYGIFDRTGVSSLIDPYSAAASMKQTLYVWLRTDAKILLPEAFAAIYSPNAS